MTDAVPHAPGFFNLDVVGVNLSSGGNDMGAQMVVATNKTGADVLLQVCACDAYVLSRRAPG